MHHRNLCIFLRVFFVLAFVLVRAMPAHAASGGLVISEVMYDPAGTDGNREWIEVYNSGSAGIDLSGDFLLTDGLSSSHHALAAQGSSVIPAGGYAVIVQTVDEFKGDYPNYSGLIFDSSWSGLSAASGKTLAVITSSGSVLDQVAYDPTIGADNDGNSLSLETGGVWASAQPTPGAANAAPGSASPDPDQNTGGNTDTDTNTDPAADADQDTDATATTSDDAAGTSAKSASSAPHMQAVLTMPKTAVAGIPITISDAVFGYAGEQRSYGATHFAFGDGTEREGTAADSFSHAYAYPGSYVVTLEYRSNMYSVLPDVTARAIVVVSKPSVVISSTGPDGLIQIANSGKSEADVSGWTLGTTDEKTAFRIPEGTIIVAGGSIVLPESVTGIPVGVPSLGLMLPSGTLAAAYGDMPETPLAMTAVPVAASAARTVATKSLSATALAADTTDVPEEAPDPSSSGTDEKKHSMLPFVVGIAGIAGSVGLAVFKFNASRKTSGEEFPDEPSPENSENEDEQGTGPEPESIRIVEE